MGNGEFAEWWAYYSIDPFGELRADIRHAALMALLANVNRDAKLRPEPWTMAEFLPDYWQTPAERDEEAHNQAMLQKFQMFAVQVNRDYGINRDAGDQVGR